ncbi:MAG: enolase C-terminal domain-like protein [Gammaproteobacteria bacterium]
MQLDAITIEDLVIPFKTSFQHSSATRAKTEAVLVKATSTSQLEGMGEGCPRKYVTGETLETAHKYFNNCKNELMELNNLEDLLSWTDKRSAEIDMNPAAFCAIELALLDLMAKTNEKSLEALLAVPELAGEFSYTAVIGSRDNATFQAMLKRYVDTGFSNFKVKIFGNPVIDQANINMFKSLEKNISLRLDANNLWSNWKEAASYIKLLDYPFHSIEEPLQVRQYQDLIELFDALSLPIILDESCVCKQDIEAVIANPEPWIINIRISKMGGILRSLYMAELCRSYKIPIILGAQVGETSILTRAALTVANNFRDILIAQEGAFGTHLLTHDVIDTPLVFGKNGILTADQVTHSFH